MSMSDNSPSREDLDYIHLLSSVLKLEEIQMILEEFNLNTFGGKRAARKQISKMLTGSSKKSVKILEQRILQFHLSKLQRLQRPLAKQIVKIQNILHKYQQTSSKSTQTVNFEHDLPFFRTILLLSNPIHCKGDSMIILNSMKLHREVESIEKSWNSKRKEFKIQIILRLEQVGCTTIVNGRLPSNIHVSVNNRDCKLPELITSTQNDTPWRLNEPIDITRYINFNKHERNILKITWSNDPHIYVAGVFLSEKLTSKDLLQILLERNLRSSQETKEYIKNAMKNNDNMNVNFLSVTLKDPLTIKRMELPARGEECKHLQCFDAIQFLQMNEQKQTWACPICKEQVKFENIEIDEYFLTILQSSNLSEETEQIILYNDGTWTESKTKRCNMSTSSNNKEILLIDSDEDSICDNFDNEEIEHKSKRLKCNTPKKNTPKHVAKTENVLKTNVNSSTLCDIVKDNSTPSASDNSIIMLNHIPGPSSSKGSNCIMNNIDNKNSVKIDDSVRSVGNKNQEKVKSRSVICVITLD